MKILHFVNGRCNPDTANGVEKTIYHLAVNQAELGHEVYLLGISGKPAIPIPGVTVEYFPPATLPWRLPAGLAERAQSIRPDIAHFHSMYIPANVLLAKRLRSVGIPYVVTPNGNCASNLLKRRPYLKLPFKILLERPYLNQSLFVHSVGDTEAIRDYGVTAPIIVAPNGINGAEVPSAAIHNPIIAARPDWVDRSVFTFIGRLDTEQKGLDLMLEGFAKAVRAGANVGLSLVGPDWKGRRENLVHTVKRLEIEDAVHFAGPAYAREKFDYLLSSDFFIHTSRWEGLSFSIIEALACGIPCLVTPAANPCGFIGRYAAGREVSLTIPGITRGLLEMSQAREDEREQMKNAAFMLVENELQWPQIAGKITDWYTR